MTKKYKCIVGSPEIPKGTMVLFSSGFNTTWCAPNNVAWTKCALELWQVEGNECWEEVKAETISPTPAKRLKPKPEGEYHYLDSDGYIRTTEYDCAIDERRYIMGNCFRTQQEARDELMRRESIANAWRSKEGEECWFWHFESKKPFQPGITVTFYSGHTYIGACHPTKEACQKWGETYAKYFLPKTE
jgi:hypothetical protein